MPLFGKKKEEDNKQGEEIISEVNRLLQDSGVKRVENLERTAQAATKSNVQVAEKIGVEKEKLERPPFAPLFVKLDRYRAILNTLGYLKTAIMMMKNSFVTMGELERAREQTVGVLREGMEKIEEKLVSLDSELIRPAGYHEATVPEELVYQDTETVEATIADLKGQIDQLKFELQKM